MEKQKIDFTGLNIEELNGMQEISEEEMASVAYLCTCTCTGKTETTTTPSTTTEK